MNHNASERQRRKKINALYSSLRGLLPSSDHHPVKKLSIPTTVSRVVKYIPELQQQVETLTLKKKQLLSTLPEHRNITKIDRNQRGGLVAPNTSSITNFSSSSSSSSSSSTVSTSWVSDDEIMVQVSFDATNNMVHVSDLLFHLEEECGLVVLNTSSFCSPQGMAFYNLHFQESRRRGLLLLDGEALSERLMSLLEQGRNLLCS
ncbi:Transcription factor ORG2 [Linum grandiflorum]